jgi:hypothetical protein
MEGTKTIMSTAKAVMGVANGIMVAAKEIMTVTKAIMAVAKAGSVKKQRMPGMGDEESFHSLKAGYG